MTYEQLINDLKNRSFKPIYFLYGEEPYYIDLVTEHITSNVLTEADVVGFFPVKKVNGFE